MRVAQIDIAHFRGIRETSLATCGSLNVLIGKNNSGKSTILDAIDTFFAVTGTQSIVAATDRAVLMETDFHRGTSNGQPIEIAITFQLDPDELQRIIDSIVDEAPQMKNALADTSDFRYLKIVVSSIKSPMSFAYISRIELVRQAANPSNSRTLFAAKTNTAIELLTRRQQVRRAERKAAELLEMAQRIDSDDFQMLRRDVPPGERVSPRVRRLLGYSSEISYELDSIIRHVDSFTEFRRQVEALATTETTTARRNSEEPLTDSVQTFSGDAQDIPVYVESILKLVGAITVLHLRDRRDPVGREEAQKLLSLKMRRKGPEVLRNIQDTVHSLLGVSIDAFESERINPQDGNRAEMDVDEVLVEMNGAGIREALRLILDNELNMPNLLLVEEPEIHLHPALELSMLRYLKAASGNAQIFLSTHSTNFLDTSEMRNVYLTRREPYVTATLLDYDQAEAAIPEELGLRLSSLFMYDRLVFVEGASDEAILRELASIVGVNLGQNNVGFVTMGSGRNFTHYATQATISLLAKRRVQLSFILDRDENSGDELDRLLEQAGSLAKVHVLQRREIENYLVVPRALAEFIAEKRRSGGLDSADTSEEMVSAQIDQEADQLRQLAIEKRVLREMCKPVYFDRSALESSNDSSIFSDRIVAAIDDRVSAITSRKENIADAIQRATEQVDQAWVSGSKLNLVPGDELLDNVCQAFGVRFRKRRDGGRLAGLLREDEVPQELVNLLRNLVPQFEG